MAQGPPDPTADHSQEPPGGLRLDSWKEIAAYLRRDVTTVRRWEKREGLPVHRHVHAKLGSVYAYADEIDEWSERRRTTASPVANGNGNGTGAIPVVSAGTATPTPAVDVPPPARFRWALPLALVCVLAI